MWNFRGAQPHPEHAHLGPWNMSALHPLTAWRTSWVGGGGGIQGPNAHPPGLAQARPCAHVRAAPRHTTQASSSAGSRTTHSGSLCPRWTTPRSSSSRRARLGLGLGLANPNPHPHHLTLTLARTSSSRCARKVRIAPPRPFAASPHSPIAPPRRPAAPPRRPAPCAPPPRLILVRVHDASHARAARGAALRGGTQWGSQEGVDTSG